MNSQEIFDVVAAHLLKQNAHSTTGRGDRAYRGEGGRQCAVGCLIPDDLYRPNLEGVSAMGLPDDVINYILGRRTDKDYNIAEARAVGLLRELQIVHDSSWPDVWRPVLRGVAHRYNLDASEVGI